MEQKTRRLEIKVTERQTNDGAKKFLTYKTFSKNGRATEVKFRQDAQNVPKIDCFIEVDESKLNLNTAGKYPVCWIADVVRIIPADEIEAERAEANAKKLEEYFG